jgi:hypothetical protein
MALLVVQQMDILVDLALVVLVITAAAAAAVLVT